MNTFVVDAGVALKWYVPEVLSSEAVGFLELSTEKEIFLLAPEIIVSEIGNILWKKCRREELTADDARKIIGAVIDSFPIHIICSNQLLPVAFEIAHAYDRTVYDSLYLALAKIKNCPLITADEHLVNAIKDSAWCMALQSYDILR